MGCQQRWLSSPPRVDLKKENVACTFFRRRAPRCVALRLTLSLRDVASPATAQYGAPPVHSIRKCRRRAIGGRARYSVGGNVSLSRSVCPSDDWGGRRSLQK